MTKRQTIEEPDEVKVSRPILKTSGFREELAEFNELLEDEGHLPEDYLIQESIPEEIDNLLACLTPQQRQVLSLRFGLEDGNELTLNKIGERLNLSRERARQIQQAAFAKLRQQEDLNVLPVSRRELSRAELLMSSASDRGEKYQQLSLFNVKPSVSTTAALA